MSSKIHRQQRGSPTGPLVWPRLTTAGEPPAPPGPPLGSAQPPCAPAPDGSSRQAEARPPQWQTEIENARLESFRQGEEAGRQKARSELEPLQRRLAQSIEELAGYRPRLRAEAEREVVELSLAIARRVLRRELHLDRDAILGLVKAAFEKVNLREVTQVRAHPAHVSVLRAHLEALGAPEVVEIREDPSLEAGGVIVETARGSLDASLATQLDEIGRGLADALSGRRLA